MFENFSLRHFDVEPVIRGGPHSVTNLDPIHKAVNTLRWKAMEPGDGRRVQCSYFGAL